MFQDLARRTAAGKAQSILDDFCELIKVHVDCPLDQDVLLAGIAAMIEKLLNNVIPAWITEFFEYILREILSGGLPKILARVVPA